MMKFTKRPVTVEAVQFLKDGDHPAVAAAFGKGFCVKSRQGYVNVNPGDWIIAEMDGSGFYPCAPDVFAATYEPAGTTGRDFGFALRAVRQGHAVRRAGWNGKGMFVALSPGNPALPAEAFWASQNRAWPPAPCWAWAGDPSKRAASSCRCGPTPRHCWPGRQSCPTAC